MPAREERLRRDERRSLLLGEERCRDDAGAGKTIMSGLLIRELELRDLAEHILIVCPANLAFQWQRELKEKFK